MVSGFFSTSHVGFLPECPLMHITCLLLRRPTVYAKRLRYSQWWKVCHFPNPLLRRYGVLESLKYSKIIHDLDHQFGMIGEAPHVQIGPDAAFIFMRHFVHREKAAAVERFCRKELAAARSAVHHTAKPTLMEKIRWVEEQSDALNRLNPRGEEFLKTKEELEAEAKAEDEHRRMVLERLKSVASDPEVREHLPVAQDMLVARKWQQFYKEPLFPLVPEEETTDPYAVHLAPEPAPLPLTGAPPGKSR